MPIARTARYISSIWKEHKYGYLLNRKCLNVILLCLVYMFLRQAFYKFLQQLHWLKSDASWCSTTMNRKTLLLNIQRMGKSSLPEQQCEKTPRCGALQKDTLMNSSLHRLQNWAKLHSEQSSWIIAWKTNILSFYTNIKRVNLKHFKFNDKLMVLKYIMIILLYYYYFFTLYFQYIICNLK